MSIMMKEALKSYENDKLRCSFGLKRATKDEAKKRRFFACIFPVVTKR